MHPVDRDAKPAEAPDGAQAAVVHHIAVEFQYNGRG